jgi:hypothetical protein
VCHRFGGRLGLHGSREGVEIGHVHDNGDVVRVLRVYERPVGWRAGSAARERFGAHTNVLISELGRVTFAT